MRHQRAVKRLVIGYVIQTSCFARFLKNAVAWMMIKPGTGNEETGNGKRRNEEMRRNTEYR